MKEVSTIIKLVLSVIMFSLLGWIYYMGIVTPTFPAPYDVLYIGLGNGFLFLIYFQMIPTYIKRYFPEVRYVRVIVPLTSAIITIIILFATFPLQI